MIYMIYISFCGINHIDINSMYFTTIQPTDNLKVESNVGDTYEVGNKFFIEVDLQTPNSIVYRFELNSLNLSISHDCADDLVMTAGIHLEVCLYLIHMNLLKLEISD